MNEIKQTLQQDAHALLKRLQQSRKNGTGVTLSVSDVGVLCEVLGGEYVVVPKSSITQFWQDDEEPENFVSKEHDFDCLGDCIDIDGIMQINKHHQAYIKTEKLYGTWIAKNDDGMLIRDSFHVGTYEECLAIVAKNKAMIEAAQENSHE